MAAKATEEEALRFNAPLARRSVMKTCKGAVSAALLRAGDELAAVSMRLRGDTDPTAPIPPCQLVEAWRVVAQAASLPAESHIAHLSYQTLAGWSRLLFSNRILLLDAWGFTTQRFPATFSLPRPLMRAMSVAIWREGGAATVQELNLAAVRTGPFFTAAGVRSADLARSILDGIIHHASVRVEQDYQLAARMGPCLTMAAFASRSGATQNQLHLLRQAASDARPLEEAIYQRVAWMKSTCRCDSVTAKSHVAAALARDSLEFGGNMRETFIKAFGRAPLGEEEEDALAVAEEALEEWRAKTAGRQRQEAAAAVAAGEVERSKLSMYTVHSDGRSEAAGSTP